MRKELVNITNLVSLHQCFPWESYRVNLCSLGVLKENDFRKSLSHHSDLLRSFSDPRAYMRSLHVLHRSASEIEWMETDSSHPMWMTYHSESKIKDYRSMAHTHRFVPWQSYTFLRLVHLTHVRVNSGSMQLLLSEIRSLIHSDSRSHYLVSAELWDLRVILRCVHRSHLIHSETVPEVQEFFLPNLS